jgi:uncharacterized protein (DUF608 family)
MFNYWVYFDKTGRPVKIVCKNAQEWSEQLRKLILENEEMPEWIQRAYK